MPREAERQICMMASLPSIFRGIEGLSGSKSGIDTLCVVPKKTRPVKLCLTGVPDAQLKTFVGRVKK